MPFMKSTAVCRSCTREMENRRSAHHYRADHGFDMSRPTWGHSSSTFRCSSPGPNWPGSQPRDTSRTAADLGQTIGEALGTSQLPSGDSFLDSLRAG